MQRKSHFSWGLLATSALAIMPEEVVNPLGMPLVRVPAGKFLMDSDESPVHKVRITHDFFREDGSQIVGPAKFNFNHRRAEVLANSSRFVAFRR